MCNAKKLREPNLFEAVAKRLGSPVVWPNGHIRNLEPKDIARPTNILPVLRPIDPARPEVGMEVADMRWWMVPFFHKGDLKAWKAMCTNARAEEIKSKATFRDPYKRRRGVAVVDGFYEWTQAASTPKPRWLVERADGQPMILPIVWDTWTGPDGAVDSYALLTTGAGPGMTAPDPAHNRPDGLLHDRQPVILEEDEVLSWLDLSTDPAAGYRGSAPHALSLQLDGFGFDKAA
jgi:putative SOS response-associated peptidase YedK